jgi:hypothetical protein
MIQNFNIQIQNQNQSPRTRPRPHRRDHGMDDDDYQRYERRTIAWNQRDNVRASHERRRDAIINNTPWHYRTGDRVHHLRCIPMTNYDDWNALFGNHILNPGLRQYAEASIDWTQDETNTLDFAGQMDVSLLMQENYRPGVHLALYFIHLTPHRHFYDGHMISVEFGDGSNTHQTIARLFDANDRAIVLQATETQMISSLADDDDAMELLYTCFVPEFAPMRFSLVAGEGYYVEGYYVADPYALDNHRWHGFTEYYNDIRNLAAAAAADADALEQAQVQIPPPPPINDFAEIYQRALREYDQEHPDPDQDPENNLIPYDGHDDQELQASG